MFSCESERQSYDGNIVVVSTASYPLAYMNATPAQWQICRQRVEVGPFAMKSRTPPYSLKTRL